uniref:Uncharacterized protein n=1 Tax=Cyprinus carpio carpio TaxID=630221 RepID=A0A9J7X9A3_CYPCA
MDFSMRIMFVLLLISLQLTGGDFSPSGERSATELNSYLEWVTSAEVPKDAVSFKDKTNEYYIAKHLPQCELCFFDKEKSSCVTWSSNEVNKSFRHVSYNEIMFLVNKDNFEMMEWKECTNQKIPPMSVETCNGYFVAKNAFGYVRMTALSLMKEPVNVPTKVLTLNTDIKMQHLHVVEYLMSSVVTAEILEVLKHFQASNKNCKPAKHTVKLDQNIDKITSYQTGRTHKFGVNAEISVNGTLPNITNIGGKLGLKYDYSRSRSNTASVVEKTLHSVGMEVEVPPNHSCTIDITSNTFTAEVPFTGEITRVYKNNKIHKTFINGTYIHQEVAELQTLVNPCQPLSDRIKRSTLLTINP